MVLALQYLYENTNGQNWTNGRNTNWLDGEPCTHNWAGVTCCPHEFPRYDEAYGLCRATAGRRLGFDDEGVRGGSGWGSSWETRWDRTA